MVADLTLYLYSNNMLRYIEGYVQKVGPSPVRPCSCSCGSMTLWGPRTALRRCIDDLGTPSDPPDGALHETTSFLSALAAEGR